MVEFLKSIASAFYEKYENLTDFCFVFPSKRSGNFFRKYLKESLPANKSILSPHILTINDFIADLSGLVIDNRIDLLFRLYKEYQKLQTDDSVDFDKFMMWGETILSDFNDVDMYDVNADLLFKNMSDFKEIQSDYLTDEQKKIISEYFGNASPWKSTNRFWRHFNAFGNTSSKSNFIKIWEVLSVLYHRLNKSLLSEGLCYPGMAYKEAYRRLQNDIKRLLPYKKVVFIGFNVLSTIELKIFSLLRDYTYEDDNGVKVSIADFYWDCTGPVLSDKDNSATLFVNRNRKLFKSELDISCSDTNAYPSVVKVISTPSNSIQTKIISDIASDIVNRTKEKRLLDQAKIAIVLPDENLLLPLLYSMPKNVKTANLTMGYPLKMTSTASFVALLRQLQKRCHLRKGKYHFFQDDVKSLIAHPYMQLLLGVNVISQIKKYINKERLFSITYSDIEKFAGEYSFVFTPFNKETTSDIVCNYLRDSLMSVKKKLQEVGNSSILKSRIDIHNIETYLNVISQIKTTINHHEIKILNHRTVFRLYDKLLSGEKVNFEGEPLQGLQVMGVLETRCLDFEYLIIPSMNERIFPQKIRQRSFIPNTLRSGYGMSTLQFQESIFAYHFYRMISRTKELYMLYDARSSGLKSGDVSRYILQLKYLYPKSNTEIIPYVFNSTNTQKKEICIDKNNDIVEKELNRFLESESKYNISASSLKTYIDCSLKFYLQFVKRLKTDEEPEEFMDAKTQGDIFHKIMEHIYSWDEKEKKLLSGSKLEKGRLISKEWIDGLLSKDNTTILRIIDKYISEIYLKTNDTENAQKGDAAIFRNVLNQFTRNCLKADRELTPFLYWGSEVKKNMQLELSDGRKVNITFVIDRLDEINITDNPTIRISDYKTGVDSVSCMDIDSLFEAGNKYKAIFQLLTYATLYKHKEGYDYKGDIRLDIYKTREIHTEQRNFNTAIEIGADKSSYFNEWSDQFSQRLNDLIISIFDKKAPFAQTSNFETCDYCPFKMLCQR